MAKAWQVLQAPSSFHQRIYEGLIRSRKFSKVHNTIVTLFLAATCSVSMLAFATLVFANPRLRLPWMRNHQESFFCDFSNYRTSICNLKGDVRVDGSSLTVALLTSNSSSDDHKVIGKIRPYTRKWEQSMKNISEVSLVSLHRDSHKRDLKCDVRHSVPAVIFSTGGYTGNVYHDFNDGLIPLFITSERFGGDVIFMVLEHKSWWKRKYSKILNQLSHHPIIDFDGSQQVHCFPEVTVGLEIHGELLINSSAMPSKKSIRNFQELLGKALRNNSSDIRKNAENKPRLVLISRKETRVIVNLNETAKLAEKIGFEVHKLEPTMWTDLSTIYQLVHSADVLLGVHGAALTHLLFLRPNSTLIQIVPLGLDGPAQWCFEQASTKAGILYRNYTLLPTESTLSEKYGLNHTVVTSPKQFTAKGWQELKKFYLDGQNIRLSLPRLEPVLRSSFKFIQLEYRSKTKR